MWAWWRLGWARALLLAALLAAANMAALRYTQDTTLATATPEYASLGGLRAWSLARAPQRRDGLLDQMVPADARELARINDATSSMPRLLQLSIAVTVQGAHERAGLPLGVLVPIGLDWPPEGCWILAASLSGADNEHSRLRRLSGLAACKRLDPPGEPNPKGDASRWAQTQRDIQGLLRPGEPVVVLSPELTRRALGEQWPQYVKQAWIGAGPIPTATDEAMPRSHRDANGRPNAPVALPAELEPLRGMGWAVHEIRHEPSAARVQAMAASLRWRWGMAALGLALGLAAAWGYRQVLALMVAVRRTGGANMFARWMDAWHLSAALAGLIAFCSAVLLGGQIACGAECAAPMVSGAAADKSASALAVALWMLWPWAGLIVGLLVTTSLVVMRANRQTLQTLFARGAQG